MSNFTIDHLSIRLLILLANSITPLCILLAIPHLFCLILGRPSKITPVFASYVFAETYFYAFNTYQRNRISRTRPPTAPPPEARKRFWKEIMGILDLEGKDSLERWLSRWFVRARVAERWSGAWWRLQAEEYGLVPKRDEVEIAMCEVKRGDVEKLLAAMFFHSELPAVLADVYQRHTLQSMLFALEARRNHRFSSGHNANIEPIAPFVQPTPMAHRPLAFYMMVAIFGKIADCLLALSGFQTYSPTTGTALGYKYHPGIHSPSAGLISHLAKRWICTSDVKSEPIIFLHGLGGYAPLTPLILSLLPLGRPVFLVEQPHVSFKLVLFERQIPTMCEMVESVNTMLVKHGFNSTKPMIIAHSLGSGLAAALNDNLAHSLKYDTLLIDPISIRLSDPHLARAYSACAPRSAFAEIIRYFTLEPGAATYVSRHFDAFSSSLDLQFYNPQLASNTRVVLSRNDFLIPVNAIEKQCGLAGVKCDVLANTNHAGWLFSLPLFMRVVEVIRESAIKETEVKVEVANRERTPTVVLNTRPQANTLCRPSILRSPLVPCSENTVLPPCTMAMNRMSRTRSRTLCGVAMMTGKSIRVGDGVSKEMRKMGSAAGLAY